MSSDTSPPSGYRLDNPARSGGATSGASVRGAPIAAEPSWTKVIATTLRLFVRRRILHVPDTGKIGRARGMALAAVVAMLVVVVAAGVVAVVVAATGRPAAHPTSQSQVTRSRLTSAQKQARAAYARAVAANTTTAATWIAAEVSEQTVIGCDPATCAAIEVAGYGSSSGQIVLRPGVALPIASAVVVATPAVRAQYGAELAATTPDIVAVFGAGPAAVQVRVVVPGGQAAYSQAMSRELRTRRSAGLKLIGDHAVHVFPAPRLALTAGLVDPRLLTALQDLAARNSVDLYSFTDGGPVASVSAPYRQAEIIGLTSRRAVTAIARQLMALPDGVRPELAIVRAPAGNYALTLRFKAPSPS